MKRLLLIFTLLFLTTVLYTQSMTGSASSAGNRGAVSGVPAITFNSFTWGTSIDAFKARMGNPAFVEDSGGYQSLIYQNTLFANNRALMITYFSGNGLEGGMYYFYADGLEEIMMCYDSVQRELVTHYGHPPSPPLGRYEVLMREMRVYETCWMLPGGYIHLKVNTRTGDPVTLWISFPALTEILDR